MKYNNYENPSNCIYCNTSLEPIRTSKAQEYSMPKEYWKFCPNHKEYVRFGYPGKIILIEDSTIGVDLKPVYESDIRSIIYTLINKKRKFLAYAPPDLLLNNNPSEVILYANRYFNLSAFL